MASGLPYPILACSPRKNGNTDRAARLFAESLAENGGGTVAEIHYLRDYRLLPCIDCNACGAYAAKVAAGAAEGGPLLADLASGLLPGALPAPRSRASARPAPFGCPLAAKDDSATLLRLLAEAPGFCLVSPVYFYHLPARFKALIDRTQPFWRFAEAGLAPYAGQERRRCFVILAGGRPSGKRLFEGSLLSLQYALWGMNADLFEPLTLYGLDGPADIAGQEAAAARERIRDYGALAGRLYAATDRA